MIFETRGSASLANIQPSLYINMGGPCTIQLFSTLVCTGIYWINHKCLIFKHSASGFPWCSGYHVRLTRERSPVRAWAETKFCNGYSCHPAEGFQFEPGRKQTFEQVRCTRPSNSNENLRGVGYNWIKRFVSIDPIYKLYNFIDI